MDTLAFYMLRRTGGRFLLMLLIFIGVLVGGQAALYLSKGVPLEALAPVMPSLLLLALPLALPLSLATAVLVVVGTMNRDGELRALASCGISHLSPIRRLTPLVVLGVLCGASLSHLVMPQALRTINANKGRFAQAAIAERVSDQRSIINARGVRAWASSAEGHNLNHLYVSRSDEGQLTTVYAPSADWRLFEDSEEQKQGLALELHDVLMMRQTRDGTIIWAEIPRWHLRVDDNSSAKAEQRPEAMSTPALVRLLDEWRPGDPMDTFNNARLALHLRLFMPISLVAFVLFAAGLALLLSTADNLMAVVLIVFIVATATYPAIGYAKGSIDHPQLHPALLLWPPTALLALFGWFFVWKTDTATALLANLRNPWWRGRRR